MDYDHVDVLAANAAGATRFGIADSNGEHRQDQSHQGRVPLHVADCVRLPRIGGILWRLSLEVARPARL
jgi:hypothetical protein